jgi:hypothetical protein
MSLTKLLLLEYNQTLRKKLAEKFMGEEPRLTEVSINAYLDRFKELKHRFPSDKRDITKLSWKEVEGLVDSFVSTKAKLGEVKITSDQNLVYDNGEGIRVFKGSDKESCIKYSTGYTFCIGSKDQGRNMYDRYRSQHGGGTPYFVINQNLPNTHVYHLSVVYKFGAKDDYFNITDAKNNHKNEKEFDSKQKFKQFYEKEFNINLDDKFVEVFKADPLDIIKEVIKAIDKGDHYLNKGDVNLSAMNLKSLKFFDKPWIVNGVFNCSDNRLTSLEGTPQEVGGDFYCSNNQLTSLEGAPQQVRWDFYCSNNQLTTLEGAPQKVGGGFHCFKNELTSLEGAPHTVGGNFGCSSNQLTSLEGAPQEVGRNFFCNNNQLTSLKGAPREVGGLFDCSDNQLTSLEGAPQKVGWDFDCSNNPNLSKEEISTYLRKIGKD